MATGEVRVLRPFKLIALLCLLVALALDVVALLSPAWVTSERGSLSLWEACKRAPDVWHCLSTLRTGRAGPAGCPGSALAGAGGMSGGSAAWDRGRSLAACTFLPGCALGGEVPAG